MRQIKKLSIVVPVYYNQDNLKPLYEDIKKKIIDVIDYGYEIVMVNDGSKDDSWKVMKELAAKDKNIRLISLSRNFGAHAAVLCGLENSTGDCSVVKAADLQEPTDMILEMTQSWKEGNNVVIAVREGREESKGQTFFANLYYWMVRKTTFPDMPKMGFDTYLLDRKVVKVLETFDEKNSSLQGQILWSGFKTGMVYYTRRARTIGKSRWTLKKKLRLVTDTLFSFSTLPIKAVTTMGVLALFGSLVWATLIIVSKFLNRVPVNGWTTLIVLNLFSFSVIMLSLGILGEYLWRTFDATRKRPPYVVEEFGLDENKETKTKKASAKKRKASED